MVKKNNKNEVGTIAMINKLHQIGEKYKCEFCLPPFGNKHSLFYAVDKLIKPKYKLARLKKMIKDVESNGNKCQFVLIGKKAYVEVLDQRE